MHRSSSTVEQDSIIFFFRLGYITSVTCYIGHSGSDSSYHLKKQTFLIGK
jgi:hypothetical protein